MGIKKLSKRRNKVSNRRNKASKRRNKVSKRRNKVSSRRNRVSKHKKLLGGATHNCYYVDNDHKVGQVPCNGYYYDYGYSDKDADKIGWYYYKGWPGRWEKKEPTLGGIMDDCSGGPQNIIYVCPKCEQKYRKKKKMRVKFNDCLTALSSSDNGTTTDFIPECLPPKQYAYFAELRGPEGDGATRSDIYKRALGKRAAAVRYRNETYEVNENICSPSTPYLTDDGYCCSPKNEI